MNNLVKKRHEEKTKNIPTATPYEDLIQEINVLKNIPIFKMDEEVIANTCIHCGALQGNWYIRDALFDMMSSGDDMTKLIDKCIPNNLEFEDLSIDRKELES